MAKVTTSFTLDDLNDRDLLLWLARLPSRKKSEAIRKALRAHLHDSGITLCDIYQAVIEIDRRLAAGRVLVTNGDATGATFDEPPDVATALDSLGL